MYEAQMPLNRKVFGGICIRVPTFLISAETMSPFGIQAFFDFESGNSPLIKLGELLYRRPEETYKNKHYMEQVLPPPRLLHVSSREFIMFGAARASPALICSPICAFRIQLLIFRTLYFSSGGNYSHLLVLRPCLRRWVL